MENFDKIENPLKSIATERTAGLGTTMPPKRVFVRIYFAQKGLSQKQGDWFFNYHRDLKWKDNIGHPVRNWKTLASEWIWKLLHT